MNLKLRRIVAILSTVALTGCAYQVGYEPTYLPDEEPDYISADEVLLVMPEEVENYEYSGGPSSFGSRNTTLTVPFGTMLKEIASEILEDRFSGQVAFANAFVDSGDYRLALAPSIKHFDYKYNQVKNAGFAVTPQVEVNLQVEILGADGNSIFNRTYASGLVSGDTYFLSTNPTEKLNQVLHKTIYDLLEQSFADARPIVVEHLNLDVD